jgi:hypothetical protein
MADVTVDGSISTATARGSRALVYTTDLIGYMFYIDGDGVFGYSKTTDGGATWGAQVNVDSGGLTTVLAFDVWFEQWTPGDTGTKIHCWWFDTTNDDVIWRTLDTNGDTLGTQRIVFAGATSIVGRGVFVSGTKTVSGYLYVCYDIDAGAERGLQRSTDSGTTWSANLSSTFLEATLDTCFLYPASGTGDPNDCWALYYDASATALTLKLWDSSAGSATESATIQTHTDGNVDLTGQFGFAGAIRHSDGHLIVAAHNLRDNAATTLQVFDCTDTSSIATLTAITTNIDDNYWPRVFVASNDVIYVAYVGKRDGTETLDVTAKVYYTKSTDGGTTWSAGDTAYMEGAAAAVQQMWTPLNGPRFAAVWRVLTANTLITNKVNSLTFTVGTVAATLQPLRSSTLSLGAYEDDDTSLGTVAGNSAHGVGFVYSGPTATANLTARLRVFAFGPPSDNLRVTLLTGAIDGSVVATGDVAGSAFSGDWEFTAYAFDLGSVTLVNGTTYYLHVARTGATSNADYYGIHRCPHLASREGITVHIRNAAGTWSTNTIPGAWTLDFAGWPTALPAGTVDVAGTTAATLGALTLVATGEVHGDEVSGTLAQTLGPLTAAATGTVDVVGTVASTLGALTAAGTGTVAVAGTTSQTLGALTAASTGTVDVAGSTSQTLGAATLVATGTVVSPGITGTVDATLGALTSTGTGTVDVVGSTSQTLGAVTAAAPGTVDVAGTGSPTLGALTSTATGTVDVVGTTSATLGALTLIGEGVVGEPPREATLAVTLGALTAAGTGTVAVSGTTTATLGAVTGASTGTVDVAGTAAIPLAALTGTGTGTVDITGQGASTLGALTLAAAGTVAFPAISGTLTTTLGALTLTGSGLIGAAPPAWRTTYGVTGLGDRTALGDVDDAAGAHPVVGTDNNIGGGAAGNRVTFAVRVEE